MRCPYGHRTGPVRESSMFSICYRTHMSPVRDPQRCSKAPLRTRKGIDTTSIGKNLTQESYFAIWGLYGPITVPARAVHGLFKISKLVLGPYAYNHASKLYEPCTGRQNSTPHGARVGPVSGRTIFCSKQPLNSPGTALAGPGVWCDWGMRYLNCLPEVLDIYALL